MYKIKDYILKYEQINDINYQSFANYNGYDEYINSVINYNDLGIEQNENSKEKDGSYIENYTPFVAKIVPIKSDIEAIYNTYFLPYNEINKLNIRLILGYMEKNNLIDVISAELQTQINFSTYQNLIESAKDTEFIVPSLSTLSNYIKLFTDKNDIQLLKSKCLRLLNSKEASNYIDSTLSVTLAVKENDQKKLETLLTQIANKLVLNPNSTKTMKIWDVDGNKHTFKIQEIANLIDRYGDYLSEKYEDYKDIINLINTTNDTIVLNNLLLSLEEN